MGGVDPFRVQFDKSRAIVPDIDGSAAHVASLDHDRSGAERHQTDRCFALIID